MTYCSINRVVCEKHLPLEQIAMVLSLGILIIFGILWSGWFYLPLILLITVGGFRGSFYTFSSIAHKDDGTFAKRYKYLAISFAVVIQLLSFLMNYRYSFIDRFLCVSGVSSLRFSSSNWYTLNRRIHLRISYGMLSSPVYASSYLY